MDLYQILGVDRHATSDAIRAAYRVKARMMHPDVGGNASDFELLAWANRILANPQKRADYDKFGRIDDRSNNQKTADAWMIVASLLNKAIAEIADLRCVDLIAVFKTQLAQAHKVTTGQIIELERKVSRIEDVQRRFHTSGDNNQIGRMLEIEVDKLKKQITQLKDALETGQIASDILATYSYDYQVGIVGFAMTGLQR